MRYYLGQCRNPGVDSSICSSCSGSFINTWGMSTTWNPFSRKPCGSHSPNTICEESDWNLLHTEGFTLMEHHPVRKSRRLRAMRGGLKPKCPHPTPHMPPGKIAKKVTFLRRRLIYLNEYMHVGGRMGI